MLFLLSMKAFEMDWLCSQQDEIFPCKKIFSFVVIVSKLSQVGDHSNIIFQYLFRIANFERVRKIN